MFVCLSGLSSCQTILSALSVALSLLSVYFFIKDLRRIVKTLPIIDDFVDRGPSKTKGSMPLFADNTPLVCLAPTEQVLSQQEMQQWPGYVHGLL